MLDNERTQPRQTHATPRHASAPTATQRKADESRAAPDVAALPSELAAVVAAWPSLPDAVRAGIVAMVKASGEK